MVHDRQTVCNSAVIVFCVHAGQHGSVLNTMVRTAMAKSKVQASKLRQENPGKKGQKRV